MNRVTFLSNGGKTVTAADGISLLRVSLREDGGIPFRCGGGICGVCKCRIEQGRDHADAVKPKELRHLTEAELAAGYRMACQTFISGDVAVSWTVGEALA
jgi:ferredoxin